MGSGAGKLSPSLSKSSILFEIDTTDKQASFSNPSPLKKYQIVQMYKDKWEKEAKDQIQKQEFFTQSPEVVSSDDKSLSGQLAAETSAKVPERLEEHLQASGLGVYFPSLLRWMEREGKEDLSELEAKQIQVLYEELGLSSKSRRLFDICLGLSIPSYLPCPPLRGG